MNMILRILIISSPLLLASFGALVSEYAGRMALFLESVINLGAFLCFAFSSLTHSAAAGIMLSIAACTLFITLDALASEKLRANPFLSALALNLLVNALVSVLSARIFGTRGVLTTSVIARTLNMSASSYQFAFPEAQTGLITSAVSFVLFAAGVFWLHTTRSGLYMRITGTDSGLLKSRGIHHILYRIASWSAAAFFASAAGCVYALRLSSFVPGVASGTGWTALAAVFLGKKNTAAVFSAVLVFSAAQYAASNLQNVPGLHAIPSSVLLALPYLLPLLLILLLPQHLPRRTSYYQ
jgi:ABC-type uncharacterized transport system permease subunit